MLSGPLVALLATAAPEVKMPTLEQLEQLGSFEVTFEGEAMESFLSGRRCVFIDWLYGERSGSEWVSSTSGFTSDRPLSAVTPKGKIELRPNRLRLFLAPSFSKSFAAQEASSAPGPVREALAEGNSPLTVEEYCLEPSKRYHARVQFESYQLPPRPGSKSPEQRKNAVLAVSDQPFKDGKPQRPLIPGQRGITY
ncbi:MAG: hypothetical protein HYZ28_15590 [Myxococcales bacterium]|nr:hypothetical protein [Myxococcales bacterium]